MKWKNQSKTKIKRKKAKKAKKIDLNFVSLCFALKQKLQNRSKVKNLKQKKQKKAKKSKKCEKYQKSEKKRLEFRFPLFHFEAKLTKVKRSEKFEAKKEKWNFIVK